MNTEDDGAPVSHSREFAFPPLVTTTVVEGCLAAITAALVNAITMK